MKLQTRLIIIVCLVLVIIGAGIGLASWLSVRQSLMSDLDEQLSSMTMNARGGPGGDRAQGPGATGSEQIDDALRYLFQPGVGDGALVVVDSGSGGQGLIAEAGQSQPQVLTSAAADALLDVPTASAAALRTSDGHTSVTVPGYGSYRVVAVAENGATTVYGIPQSSVDSALARTAGTTALVVAIGVVLTAAATAVVIHRQLRDLRDVAATARKVTDLELEEGKPELALRVPPDLSEPGTEVGDVGAAVNRMLDHVGSALDARYAGTEQMRRFVADASHELRTPIATIRGWADLTRPHREELPAEVATSLAKIDAGAMRMSSLVDDLLLLARLEAGRQPTKEEAVDVSALLIELVEDAHVLSPEHAIALDVPPEALEARGAGDQVRQAVSIVLTNACVHTPPGTRVRIEAQTAEAAATDRPDDESPEPALEVESLPAIVIRIADDGPGIPEEIRETVFDRFVRGDASRARADGVRGGSSGLGLAIAQGLVDLMGGSLEMESSVAGTVVEFRLRAA